MIDRITITLPNRVAYVAVALANVREGARMLGFSPGEVEELVDECRFVNYSVVAAHTDTANELLGYIRRHDPNESL
jgi:hypothetical protein